MSLDFYKIGLKETRNGFVVRPRFQINLNTKDLLIRGGDFYAVWNPDTKLWSTSEGTIIEMIDGEIRKETDRLKTENPQNRYFMALMSDADSDSIDRWHKYCKKQMTDTWSADKALDSKVIFANTETTREDYATKKLPYAIGEGDYSSFEELISVLYEPEERAKIEWTIGSIIAGASKHLQKFLVFYGSAGAGKSTILNIIQDLLAGYWTPFRSKDLGRSNAAFAMESFKSNPLVAIEHDGDLSKIEDNTRLNSIVSHETMELEEKFKSKYPAKLQTFLIIATNRPVKITEAKSGLLRRLIDVRPSGNLVPTSRYDILMNRIEFEKGAIAQHCLDIYNSMGEQYYAAYVPTAMFAATNDFYDFMQYELQYFLTTPLVPRKEAFRRYNEYCEYANIPKDSRMRLRIFSSEMENYFRDFKSDYHSGDTHYSSVFMGFKREKFGLEPEHPPDPEEETKWLIFRKQPSLFDEIAKDWPAQYELPNANGRLETSWDKCTKTLSDILTSEVHYVRVPLHHIVIDFDIKEDGQKSLEKNLEAANKWPPTYAELSKSGAGIHLHYIYNGDPTELRAIYDDDIEVKVFTGKSALRRKLTACNDIPVAHLSGGLPVKERKGNVLDFEGFKDDKHLRNYIDMHLRKGKFSSTSQSISAIKSTLDDLYSVGVSYDLRDYAPQLQQFALHSSNSKDKCLRLVSEMHLCSKDVEHNDDGVINETDAEFEDDRIIIWDCEVYKNLYLICWKYLDEPEIHVEFNPSSEFCEWFAKQKTVGFNNRGYDNHILYARMLGYDCYKLWQLSRDIVAGKDDVKFVNAYQIGFADILDYSSKKQSLKKWEIELGIHHQEMGIPWDEPAPEDQWDLVAEYCKNDVVATEAVFKATYQDLVAREILADLSGLKVINTTRQHTTKIIFGDNRHPSLNYPDIRETFPDYAFVNGKNMYRGIDVGFGGYVYSEPGMYTDVALLDVASLHPNSIRAMNLFGDYTKNYTDILDARIAIKRHDLDAARGMLDGKLAPYLGSDEDADKLAQALKIVINSVYGYTSATFPNPFKDERNVNNIVALRGALFMVTLMQEVQKRGFIVAHIKTDSIKIPNATPEIIQFCMDFARQYGYSFEHEATYEKMCLVNQAVYIAKYRTPEVCELYYGYVPGDNKKAAKKEKYWTATGAQFQVPYVFKKLFSGEEIVFKDLCETKSVAKGDIYLDFNEKLGDVTYWQSIYDARLVAARNGKLTKKAQNMLADTSDISDEELLAEIAKGHQYMFVGRVGLFCPVKDGVGGGILYRKTPEGQYMAITGTKGYRWLEAEYVESLDVDPLDIIDRGYYDDLATEAINTMSKYGDTDEFRFADVPADKMLLYVNTPTSIEEELPWVD